MAPPSLPFVTSRTSSQLPVLPPRVLVEAARLVQRPPDGQEKPESRSVTTTGDS